MSEPHWTKGDATQKRDAGMNLAWIYPLLVVLAGLVVANHFLKLHLEVQVGDEFRAVKDAVTGYFRGVMP